MGVEGASGIIFPGNFVFADFIKVRGLGAIVGGENRIKGAPERFAARIEDFGPDVFAFFRTESGGHVLREFFVV